MLISTKGRYALRVLVDLAEHRGENYVPLSAVAERHGISEKYLESVLKPLVREKIIAGLRGKGGGYKLIPAPEELTLGRVLRLVEPGLTTVNCLRPGGEQCERAGECSTLPVWRDLDTLILNYLDGRTLSELLRPPAE